MTDLKPKIRINTDKSDDLRKLAADDDRFEVDHVTGQQFHYVLVDTPTDPEARALAIEVFGHLAPEENFVTVHPQAPTIDRFALPVSQ